MAKKVTTTADLEAMGLVLQPDGTYRNMRNVQVTAVGHKPINLNESSFKQMLVGGTILNQVSIPLIVFEINPMGKPRMTQRDKWLNPPRKPVALYWKFKDYLIKEANKIGFKMPESSYHIIAYIQMPHSWPDKKKNYMDKTPHQQKPDKDNIEKGILDALCKSDAEVWDGRITKYWSRSGKILIYRTND